MVISLRKKNRINSDGVWKVTGASVRENMCTWRMVIDKRCPGEHGMKAFVVVEAELHAFLTLALEELVSITLRPSYTRCKSPRYALNSKLSGPQMWSRRFREKNVSCM